jgi:lipid-binding SYLF domain-containing protein
MRHLRVLFIMLTVISLALAPAAGWAAEQPAGAPPDAGTKADQPAAASDRGRNDEKPTKANEEPAAARRAKLDEIAQATLDKLFSASPDAKGLHDRAYGYAVFDNTKVGLGLSGAGGSGVAVSKTGGKRTYMKMGSGGVGVGAGYQEYQLVFFFEDEKSFNNFINEGWTADAQATAVGGKAGASAAGDFRNGVALFKLNEKGVAAHADVSGTRYWKDKKLNT